jgi:hypothetical protein
MPSTDFHITGPTVVLVTHPELGNDPVEFGYTDNDDMIRLEATDHKQVFTNNSSGDMIRQAIFLGTTWTIDMTLVSWDEDVLNRIIKVSRLGIDGQGSNPAVTIASQGSFATVGGLLVPKARPDGSIFAAATEDRTIGLIIEPKNTGAAGNVALQPDRYVFASVMLQAGPKYIDIGNAAKRLAWSWVTVYKGTSNGVSVVNRVTA